VVALLISVNDDVTARLGASGTALTATGAIKVTATHHNIIRTEGNAEAAGKDTAVGIDISVNAVVGWDTLAEIDRNVTCASVDVLATSDLSSQAKSVASAKGAESSDSSGDSKSNEEVNGSNNPNTQGPKSSTAGMPSSNGGTNGSNGAAGADSQQSGQSGQGSSSGSSSTGVAAAIAVNWVVATSTARIAANRTVTATTGAVTVRSLFAVAANALGMGSAIDLESDGTRVGATIGINVQDITNQATIGGGTTHITGQTGIIVEAASPGAAPNDFIVWSFAAAGGKSTSVAGSAAVQILLLKTKAWVGAGAELDAPAGGITINAQQPMRLQNLAF
jgi:hypothetical protein